MKHKQTNRFALSSWLTMGIVILTTQFLITGCSRHEKAYQKVKTEDSIKSWTDFLQHYPNSIHVEEARERLNQLNLIHNLHELLKGQDAVAKTIAILQLQKMPDSSMSAELVPALIATLTDETNVQIPENVIGANVKLSNQFSRGTVLRMREGDMFSSDSGMVYAGKNAILRISTPADEARTILARIAGEDFGLDSGKWQEWWTKYSKK